MQGELSKRFALWRDAELAQLLCRIEEQRRVKIEKQKLQRSVEGVGTHDVLVYLLKKAFYRRQPSVLPAHLLI